VTVELKEFVKQTLLDILKGVAETQQDTAVGKAVVPGQIGDAKHPGSGVSTVLRQGALISVSFDVAVTAETSDAAKGGGGFKVAVLGMGASAGGELGSTTKNVAVTRIQFSVPVLLSASDRPQSGASPHLQGRA
jgi:hypothetical protein